MVIFSKRWARCIYEPDSQHQVMKVKVKNIGILLVLALLGCSTFDNTELQIIELDISKSTIPEGIVVHPESKEIFLSSVHEDRITKSSRDGKSSEVVLSRKINGYSLGVGMEIWKNKLYALSKFNRTHQSILTVLDLKSNSIKTVKSSIVDTTYFNDLAIDKNGNCYMTDTDIHNIYFYNSKANKIDIFLNTEKIRHPNGIAISSDGSKLFIDSWTSGIKIVDIATRRVLNKNHELTTKEGIDGIKYYKGKLYYVKNGGRSQRGTHGLYRIDLLNDETELGKPVPIHVNHEKMCLPTTLSIVENDIYILANSQLDKLDQEEHKIINYDSLTNTYILKYVINDND